MIHCQFGLRIMSYVPEPNSFDDQKDPNGQLLAAIDFSTGNLPGRDQFDAFCSTYRGVADMSLVRSREASFPARVVVWDLGRLVFKRTKLPGKGYTHRLRHVGKTMLDHWYVNLPVRSSASAPALPGLHCLATPFENETDADGRIALFIPYDLFAPTLSLDRMLNAQFEGGPGRLLADYLVLLDRSLADLRASEVPYLVEATRSLIAACLAPSRDRLAEAQSPIDATLMGRARRLVRARLADPDLTPDLLCMELGVSRSRLYRLFEPLGGIAGYIRKQRLLRTREALSDTADARPISRIADQWGFADASAYSRTFRQEFGISPKEARGVSWDSNRRVAKRELSAPQGGSQSLYNVLRSLSP